MANDKKTTKPRKAVKKAAAKPRRKARAPTKMMSQPEKASCSVTRTLTKAVTNQMYVYNSFNLSDYDRAVAIAKNYQRFRITGIKLTFKPEYDTYSAVASGGATKPYLYYMIDKSGSIPDNVTLEGLKQAGAKPHRFDEAPLTVMWRPSVLQETSGAGFLAQGSGYKVSPMLATSGNTASVGAWNPSTINHLGIKWYMETAGSSLDVYIEAEVQFEFYKANFPVLSSSAPKTLEYAKPDASPDGVEGGKDGITIPLV